MLPIGRQLNSPSINAQGLGNINERIPLDWRQVRVQQDGQNWKLVYAGYVLADFGKNEPEAKRALGVVQHYRFSEQCLVGRPKPSLTYYLVGGQAPRGVLIGVNATSFQAETLSLQWRGNKWAIVDGYRPLMEFGDKPEEAKQAMQAIKQQKFDTICRVGASDAPGMTFLVRTR